MHVLVVEDHADTAELLCRWLVFRGHRGTWAADAGQAFALCQREEFDLMLCDIGLGEEDGWALLRRLRAGGCGVQAVAVSGYARAAEIEQSVAAGFAAHVCKPVDLITLGEVIERLGRKRAEAP